MIVPEARRLDLCVHRTGVSGSGGRAPEMSKSIDPDGTGSLILSSFLFTLTGISELGVDDVECPCWRFAGVGAVDRAMLSTVSVPILAREAEGVSVAALAVSGRRSSEIRPPLRTVLENDSCWPARSTGPARPSSFSGDHMGLFICGVVSNESSSASVPSLA